MATPEELNALEVAALIIRLIREKITPEESVRLNQWIAERESNRTLYNQLLDESYQATELARIHKFDTEAALNRINLRREAIK